jgi:phosphate starvation-inducible PhoH-like protein
LYNFISPKEVTYLMEEKIIEISPLGYMRGRTFKNCWIVADEMQNSSVSQMKMLLTRLGENSRLVITGDLEQYDRANELNGLEDFLQKFRGKRSSSITSFEFQRGDIQREEVVKEVLDIYSAEHTLNYLPSQEEINEDLQYSKNNIDNKSTTTEDESEEKENSDKDV